VQIIRNQDLIPAATRGWQKTNNVFIYRTPLVMASSPLVPLFSVNNVINVAQLPSAGIGTRSLISNLAALAASLTQNLTGSLTSLPVKVSCDYQYPLASGPLILLPVTMTILDLPTDPAGQQQQFASPLSQVLNTWLDSTNPTSPPGAQWLFNVIIFSAYGAGQPILNLAFSLALADYTES
jgi:hypothetical protein